MSYRRFKITGIMSETKDTRTFVLEASDGLPVYYKPGQFLTFIFRKGEKEDRRSFSISSSPVADAKISVTIKRLPNGEFSRPLVDHAKEGDELLATEPTGFFTLPEKISSKSVFLFFAAGSGITPEFAMIKTLLHTHSKTKIILVYSNRSEKQTIFLRQLRDLENKFPGRFIIEFLFSNALHLEKARLGKWMIGPLLKKYSVIPGPETFFYLCGPYAYMRMATIELLTLGAARENIRKEIFLAETPFVSKNPPDKEKHNVELISGEHHFFLEVQYPETILQAAKKKNIAIPYSCESGQCGACSAHCIKGKTWMAYNEVLSEKEIEEGRVLTCQGFPIGGDVTLKI